MPLCLSLGCIGVGLYFCGLLCALVFLFLALFLALPLLLRPLLPFFIWFFFFFFFFFFFRFFSAAISRFFLSSTRIKKNSECVFWYGLRCEHNAESCAENTPECRPKTPQNAKSCSENAPEFRELLREWPFHFESFIFLRWFPRHLIQVSTSNHERADIHNPKRLRRLVSSRFALINCFLKLDPRYHGQQTC